MWADLTWTLMNLWPDTSPDAVTTSRAVTRLQTAFISDRVDIAAVHREMLAVTNFFGDLEAQAQVLFEFRQDRTED